MILKIILELRLDDLKSAGCEQVYQEKISGKSKARTRAGKNDSSIVDTVVVWNLDRLGRSLKDLIELVSLFRDKGVEFISLKDGIDTSTATGRFTFNIFASLAEFIRKIIRERTMAGLEAAKARGKKVADPKNLARKFSRKPNTPKYFMKVARNQFRKLLKDWG